jgi:hypothetical protein
MIILGANFSFVSANYNHQHQQVFNFAAILKYGAVKEAKPNTKILLENEELANWLIDGIKKNKLSEITILVINSHHLTFEQKIEFLKTIKPTTFKKCITSISKGLTNTAKFTGALAAVIILPALISGSITAGYKFIKKF